MVYKIFRSFNPFQYSCPDNPVDRGAWWAAVHGVAQSRTRLKQLSSSSILISFLNHLEWYLNFSVHMVITKIQKYNWWEIHCHSSLIFPYRKDVISLTGFKTLFLSSFQKFDCEVAWCWFLCVFLFGICLGSFIYRLMGFAKFVNFSFIISLSTFSTLP